MPGPLKMRIEGAEALARNMRSNRALRVPVLNFLHDSIDHVHSQVVQRVPVDEGEGRASVRKMVDPRPIPLFARVWTSLFYLRFLEHGTQHIRRRQMFRRGLTASRHVIRANMAKLGHDITLRIRTKRRGRRRGRNG